MLGNIQTFYKYHATLLPCRSNLSIVIYNVLFTCFQRLSRRLVPRCLRRTYEDLNCSRGITHTHFSISLQLDWLRSFSLLGGVTVNPPLVSLIPHLPSTPPSPHSPPPSRTPCYLLCPWFHQWGPCIIDFVIPIPPPSLPTEHPAQATVSVVLWYTRFQRTAPQIGWFLLALAGGCDDSAALFGT